MFKNLFFIIKEIRNITPEMKQSIMEANMNKNKTEKNWKFIIMYTLLILFLTAGFIITFIFAKKLNPWIFVAEVIFCLICLVLFFILKIPKEIKGIFIMPALIYLVSFMFYILCLNNYVSFDFYLTNTKNEKEIINETENQKADFNYYFEYEEEE